MFFVCFCFLSDKTQVLRTSPVFLSWGTSRRDKYIWNKEMTWDCKKGVGFQSYQISIWLGEGTKLLSWSWIWTFALWFTVQLHSFLCNCHCFLLLLMLEIPCVVLLPREQMPEYPEHLSVSFHCSNSSSHSLSKGCQTAFVRGGEAVKLVLLLSQGRTRKLSSEANWILCRENRVAYKPQFRCRAFFLWDCANRKCHCQNCFSDCFPLVVWKEPCGSMSSWLLGPHARAIQTLDSMEINAIKIKNTVVSWQTCEIIYVSGILDKSLSEICYFQIYFFFLP